MATNKTGKTTMKALKIPNDLLKKIERRAKGNVHGYLIKLLEQVHK